MKVKRKYLFIEPYVHVSVINNNVLLYNTLNKELLYSKKKPSIVNFINDLIKNSFIININPYLKLEDEELNLFIKKTEDYFMVDYIFKDNDSSLPLRLYYQTEYSKAGIAFEENAFNYLNEVTLYINEYKRNDAPSNLCFNAYKQFIFPIASNTERANLLSFQNIQSAIKNFANNNVTLNIVGGNPFNHPKIKNIVSYLESTQLFINYYVYYKDIHLSLSKLFKTMKSSFLNILIDCPVDYAKFKKVFDEMQHLNISCKYIFIVSNKKNVSQVEQVVSLNNLQNVSFLPYYFNNLTFFKQNIFINKQDIIEQGLTIDQINGNKMLNQLNYGKIMILSDGDVYTNLNIKKIGNIFNNTLFNLIEKEVNEIGSWFLTRDKVIPCKNCIFRYLCPPISNYEHVIKRNNLCQIKAQ